MIRLITIIIDTFFLATRSVLGAEPSSALQSFNNTTMTFEEWHTEGKIHWVDMGLTCKKRHLRATQPGMAQWCKIESGELLNFAIINLYKHQ